VREKPRAAAHESLRIVAFGLRALTGVDGGIETHARELYPRLAARGCEIEVVTRARYEKTARATAATPAWLASGRVREAAQRVTSRPLPAPRGKGIEAFAHALLAAAYCGVKRPDLVHVHGIGPAVLTPLLRALGLRVVVTHHGHDYDAEKWGPLARALLRAGEFIGVRTANAVITVSDALRQDVLASHGVACRTIYNGIVEQPNLIEPPDDPRIASLAEDRFVLVVGRITAHKRVTDAIAAFEAQRDARLKLVVCGGRDNGDPYVARVEAAAARNPRIVLAGFVPAERLPWLYSRALCTVMASSYEGMPLAVLEALSSGGRVLLSDIAAHRELALDPACYYPLGDVAALAGRLESLRSAAASGLLEDGTRLPTEIAAKLAWPTIADQTRVVYDAALARRRKR
jgi:glycosyltransferase involved in cell wall biosynthesis